MILPILNNQGIASCGIECTGKKCPSYDVCTLNKKK